MEHLPTEKSDPLIDAFVAAFPEYIVERLAALQVTPGEAVAAAVHRGTTQLETELRELLTQPAEEQAEAPLELVRRATVPVSDALHEMGVRPVSRDEWDGEAHPEDRYGLYPATSLDLGEDAWRRHLEWGKNKAKAVAGMVPAREATPQPVAPAVVLFGVPMGERDELAETIAGRGFRVLIWRNPAALADVAKERPVVAIVHLDHPEAHTAIRQLNSDVTKVIAVGTRVDDLMMPGILALGAAEVLESSRLLGRLDALLPDIV